MKTPEQAARLLTQGMLSRSAWPELADEDFAGQVTTRLEAVGLDLAAGDGYWVAKAHDAEQPDGFEPIFSLDNPELAVLAALYLHLRYLPRQGGADDGDTPSVAVEDIERGFPGGYRVTYLRIVLGHLRNAHFISQRDGRYYAGPYLAALDEVVADERAGELLRDFRLRRYLRRVLDDEEPKSDAAD